MPRAPRRHNNAAADGLSRSVASTICGALLLAGSALAAPATGVSPCLDASDADAVPTCRNIARRLAHDRVALMALGETLAGRHRYRDAIAVYTAGLEARPGDRELMRRKTLAHSDWQENTWIGLNTPHSSAAASAIATRLEVVKCTALSGAAATATCRSLLAKADLPPELKGRIERRLAEGDGNRPEVRHHPGPDAAATARTAPAKSPPPAARPATHRRHALIIGNDAYRHFPQLETAGADAAAIADLLAAEYGFQTHILLNTDRHRFFDALARLRATLTPADELLIYYAGHGVLDRTTGRGYWLPVEAERVNPAHWISTADLNDMMLALPAKRVLVVSDSCYAGTLAAGARSGRDGSDTTDGGRTGSRTTAAVERTRAVLTSGGLEPVLDNAYQGHSVFARALIDQLSANAGTLSAADLSIRVRDEVQSWTEQTPQYARLENAGHTGGDFLFERTRR